MAVRCLRDMPWLTGRSLAEPEVHHALSKLNSLLEPKVFWDVGANLGFYSWALLAKNEFLTAKLFEPDPENQRLIQKTIRRNGFTTAELDSRALSDSIGETTFLVDEQSGATGQFSHLYESASEASIAKSYAHSKTIKVETTTLDAIIKEGALPPHLMKIDVEEAEDLVLTGGTELITSHRPVIVMESFGESSLKILASHDYKSYVLDANRNFLCIPEPSDDRVLSLIEPLTSWRPQ